MQHRNDGLSPQETIRVASLVSTMITVNATDEESRDSQRIKSYIAKMEQGGITDSVLLSKYINHMVLS